MSAGVLYNHATQETQAQLILSSQCACNGDVQHANYWCPKANMHHSGHAVQSHLRWRAETLYLSLHEFRMALVDLHLLELILPVVRV